jgi:AP-2 complex subunit mu-1
MISSILLINLKGEILILRAYKDNVSRSELQVFCNRVVAAKESRDKPVQNLGGCHFIHTTHGDVVLVAATKDNVNVVLVLKLLYKMMELFRAYFDGAINENQIRRNFVLIYELLDEIIDYGYPQILEADVLKKYITQGGAKTGVDLNDQEQLKKITVQATGVCSWRAEGIKYRKNEVYIDVVENINILMSAKRERLRADVSGQIIVKCQLSGMPECKFGMNDKLIMSSGDAQRSRTSDKGIALDDFRFHQCVRLSKFDVDREITFIPPDGNFELMTYRITENIESPFKLLPNIKVLGRNRLELSLQITAMYDRNITATNVTINVPCPKNTARGHIHNAGHGKARYEPDKAAIIWRIRRFPGRHEYALLAEVELASTVTDKQWVRPPITMSFDVPQFTASGLRVRFLKVQEKSNYKPVKWIRYLTRAGSYQHRI